MAFGVDDNGILNMTRITKDQLKLLLADQEQQVLVYWKTVKHIPDEYFHMQVHCKYVKVKDLIVKDLHPLPWKALVISESNESHFWQLFPFY